MTVDDDDDTNEGNDTERQGFVRGVGIAKAVKRRGHIWMEGRNVKNK